MQHVTLLCIRATAVLHKIRVLMEKLLLPLALQVLTLVTTPTNC